MVEIINRMAGEGVVALVPPRPIGGNLVLILPNEGERSRRVVTRSRARPTGKYPSWKMGRMIQWESIHERNTCIRLDADPQVKRFQEQPLKIEYEVDGEIHTHFPDLLVEAEGRELWEVKSRNDAAREKYVARTRLMEAALPNYGYRYRLIIGEDMGQEPQLSNAKTLLQHGRQGVTDLAREKLRQILAVTSVVSWGSALNGDLGPQGRVVLSRLVLEGFLTFDNTLPLSSETRLELAKPSDGTNA